MNLFQKSSSLRAVCNGNAQSLANVPDEAFASEMLGKGFAIEPSDGIFYSPVDGKIESIAQTLHAYTILSNDGHDILVHIGVDTVKMNGEGFESLVKEGQTVKAGDPLAEADPGFIRQKGFSPITSVLVTDADTIEHIEYRFGMVSGGSDSVMTYRNRKKG
jgi:glucose-specific phosphotransferase system IIA component